MFKRLALLFILFAATVSAHAQTQEQEANLKAAFIYNFTRYVDWEKNNNETEFLIGIVGSSTVATPLQQIAATKMAGNKKITIRFFDKPEDITYCQLLFIPRNQTFPLRSILEKTGRGTLTVSEEQGFAKMGTAFNFYVSPDNKLKFEASLKAIYLSGLKVSSQLLKLANIVD